MAITKRNSQVLFTTGGAFGDTYSSTNAVVNNAAANNVLICTVYYGHNASGTVDPVNEPTRLVTDTIGNHWQEVAHAAVHNPDGHGSVGGISTWICLAAKAGANSITVKLTGLGAPVSFGITAVYSEFAGWITDKIIETATTITDTFDTAAPTFSYQPSALDFTYTAFWPAYSNGATVTLPNGYTVITNSLLGFVDGFSIKAITPAANSTLASNWTATAVSIPFLPSPYIGSKRNFYGEISHANIEGEYESL